MRLAHAYASSRRKALTVVDMKRKISYRQLSMHYSGGAMSRIQLALNVDNLDESVAFYSTLFGVEPAKTKPGYANFAVAEPPLKLVLVENAGRGGTINHLGVEVADTDAVDAEQNRLDLTSAVAEQQISDRIQRPSAWKKAITRAVAMARSAAHRSSLRRPAVCCG
jgi:hypothetical protein